ncbi:MAG TPA: arsenate reductase ArsC [Candidatus Acidoferrum sp.]
MADKSKTPKVLFLCTGHPERSEMAEGFLRKIAGGSVIPVSAAVDPAPVNPLAVDAMKEVGIDISGQEVKDIPTIFRERFAYAIGVGDESKERCPVFPFAFRLFRWNLEDPAAVDGSNEERLAAFRRVRTQIDHNVREFLGRLSDDQARIVPAG